MKNIKVTFILLIFFLNTIAQTNEKNKDQVKNPAEQYAKENAGEMKFEAVEIDFGKIKQGEKVTHEFKFSNIGKLPIVIKEAKTTCGCTTPFYTREPVEFGKTGSIKVTFDSEGKFGIQNKTITIKHNGKKSPVILTLKGEVLDKEGKPMKNPFEDKENMKDAKKGANKENKLAPNVKKPLTPNEFKKIMDDKRRQKDTVKKQ